MRILVFFLFIAAQANAQLGGKYIYTFSKLPNSARALALGSSNIALYNNDMHAALFNPALLSHNKNNNALALNHGFLPSKIGAGNIVYARTIKNIQSQFAVQYIHYGKMLQTDEYNTIQGEIKSAEYIITAGASKKIDKFNFGVNAKYFISNIAQYKSSAVALDIAAAYIDTTNNFCAAILFKNFGFQLSRYNGEKEKLPTDIQVGVSKKLRHLPLRFQAVFHDIQQLNITYVKKDESESIFGEVKNTNPGFFEHVFRHFIVGAEINFGKHIFIRSGFNYQKRKEMQLVSRSGLAGFSMGLGIKTKKFNIDYGYGSYHPLSALHQFTFATNIDNWTRKK